MKSLKSVMAILLGIQSVMSADQGVTRPADEGMTAANILEAAIAKGVPAFNGGQIKECVAIYEAAAREVLQLPEGKVSEMDRETVRKALDSTSQEATEKAWSLRKSFDALMDNASFKPLIEAPLPEGFPGVGPIGRVVEKSYPVYRAASAEGGRGAFWSLFNHIKKNEVAMTAPVEMTMNADMEVDRMAFLYERTGQGKAGADGPVQVANLPALKVLSIALRGNDDSKSIAMAKQLVEAHLKKDHWETNGNWRVLGYNSPMVPASKRVWELQIPVKEKSGTEAQTRPH